MLQQTQVERVISYYQRFLKRFPTIESLAKVELREVLALWSGLGYNRRARYLWKAARLQITVYKGNWPQTSDELQKLPGVGPAVAAMIGSCAFGQRVALTRETNVRQVIHHFFFSGQPLQPEKTYTELARRLLPSRISPREWNYAMMDYGSLVIRPKNRADRLPITVDKQGKFNNSNRYWRGEIIRRLLKANRGLLLKELSDIPEIEQKLQGLVRDQLVAKQGPRILVK